MIKKYLIFLQLLIWQFFCRQNPRSGLDPDPDWIRIRIGSGLDPDPDWYSAYAGSGSGSNEYGFETLFQIDRSLIFEELKKSLVKCFCPVYQLTAQIMNSRMSPMKYTTLKDGQATSFTPSREHMASMAEPN